MNIGLTYNIRHVKPDINDPQYIKEAEFDEPITIEGITKALEALGHKVFHVEADENAYLKLKDLKGTIDIVFNIAEGIHGADREAQIPAMLEMLGIPYTGPKPLSYAVGLNKSVAKEILGFYGIKTPRWKVFRNLGEIENGGVDFYPALAKPLGEGSSKGIKSSNLVNDSFSLKKVVRKLLEEFRQPVIVEEYLPGREFTVGMLGNPPKILSIVEITFDDLPENMPKFEHYESKWVYDDPAKGKDPLVCPANIDVELEKKIGDLCFMAFEKLQMLDWARFDIRLDVDGEPYFIEVNCPPGITPHIEGNSRFVRAAKSSGMSYEQMIEEILKSSCKRYNIEYPGR
ncbi:MAG: D-alanine--D-alanine ligase [Candidatus Magasanikbacteria bacterium]